MEKVSGMNQECGFGGTARRSGGTIRVGDRMAGMIGKRQFSLSHLLLEVFWIAVAVGFTRYPFTIWYSKLPQSHMTLEGIFSTLAFAMCWGVVLGGLVGNMRDGALAGTTAGTLLVVFLAALMNTL
jgi:hypothetical protein